MSTETTGFLNGLPQTGWITEQNLASALNLHPKTLRRWLSQSGEGTAKNIAGVVVVCVDRFYAALPDLTQKKQETPRGKEKKGPRT